MNINEYIASGVVLQRLQNKLTGGALSEFNALADLHPELRAELVYAYHLLTEFSASCPPDQVVLRFKEAYAGHLQKFRSAQQEETMPFAEAKDLSGKYAVYPRGYKIAFYCYLVFLAVVIMLTVYFYLRLHQV